MAERPAPEACLPDVSLPAALQALEYAAFAAWPPALSVDVEGWRMHLDRGYTKRANSMSATDRSVMLSADQIDAVERRFLARGLTPVFRLTSFCAVPGADAQLERRGYDHCDASLVMTRTLSEADACPPAGPDLVADARQWLAAYQIVAGKTDADQAAHLDILQRIASPVAWAVHAPAGAPLSCGLGVAAGPWLGLFDLATHADARGRGLARQLCAQIMAWGQKRGARAAFLQVVATNEAAVRLYQALGFQVAYTYWYRVGTRQAAAIS